MYPQTLYGHSVATLEIIFGMFGMAVVTGVIFVRFSRPTARILFSDSLVIGPFDGTPTLMLRIANLRHDAMVEAEFRVMFFRNESNLEGGWVRRFYFLKLQFDRLISFPAALTLRHTINEASPLFGATPETLKETDARFMASVVCIDTVIPAPVQTQKDYTTDQVLWNQRFVEIYTVNRAGKYTVDYGKIVRLSRRLQIERRPVE